VNAKRLVVVAVLAVALIVLWSWWRSDRRRISARLDEIESLLDKSGAEDQLTAFGRTRRIVAAFAPGFVVLARPYEGSISDAQQLAAVIQRYRESSSRIEVGDSGRDTAIDSARGTAETTAVFRLAGERGSGPGTERFRARIAWVKSDGEWRIQEFEILEVLERGGLLGL
jgi:hypothetical protein